MTLLLNNDDVKKLLTMEMTIAALDRAYRQMMTGEAVARPRIDVRIPTGRTGYTYQWGTMEGGSVDPGYFAIRMKSDVWYYTDYAGVSTQEKYCVEPGKFFGLIMLFDVHTAEPLAIINDGYLQHMRVAADSGIGARYLAREDARVIGMLGSGGMARAHVDAMRAVRNIQRVQVFSPTREHREAYVREMAERFEIEAVALDNPREVFRGADIVCECTDSTRPVVIGQWLDPGTHVTNVLDNLDNETYRRIDVSLRLGNTPPPVGAPEMHTRAEFVTYAARGGELPGGIGGSSSGEISRWDRLRGKTIFLEDLLGGRAPGRTSAAQITHSTRGNVQGAQFFSVGGAVYEAARAAGIGKELPTEWFLQDIRD